MSILSLLAFVLALSVVSAAVGVDITQNQAITLTQNGSITVTNTGDVTADITLLSAGDFTVSFSDNLFSLAAGAQRTVDIAPLGLDEVGFGGKTTTITARASDGTEQVEDSLSMTVTGSFCRAGERGGNLEITDVKIDNNGDGDDEEWMLLDTIEITVEVENDGNDDIDDVFVEIGLFDSDGENQVRDLDFENADEEEYDLGDLRDGDSEEVTFTFRVPADFEDGSYRLTVKAYSDDLGESNECTSTSSDLSDDTFQDISVERESDEGKFITFEDVEFVPMDPTCGETVRMTLDVFNIGDEDQDQVRVNLRNTELGLNEFVEIRSDLDQGDSEGITFDFEIPQNAQNKFYTLLLSSEYDYRNGNYRQESDDDTQIQMRVIGCAGGTPGNQSGRIAIISAALDSEDVSAGQELVVRGTVTNLKSQTATFVIDVTGYNSWASLDSVEPRTLTVPAGASSDFLVTFNIDESSSGEESFTIRVSDGQGNTESREVGVNVGGASGGVGEINFGSPIFWGLLVLNVLLIVVIIIVAVRVARR